MRRYLRVLLAVAGLLLTLGCSLVPVTPTTMPAVSTETPVPPTATAQPTAGVANPASQFCVEQGGQVEIRTAADGGQVGYCVFSDGSECEEWAFFRDECVPGGTPVAAETPVSTDELVAAVWAELPEGAYNDVGVLPLVVPSDQQPLWAVFSVGMRSFDPLRSHFVAIYTHDGAGWRELAQIALDEAYPPEMYPAMPDMVFPGGVTQVQIDPACIWLTVEGGVGAHGGTFQLLGFDGATLNGHVSGSAASPGAGGLQDVNGDGVLDVILDQSDAYVFCYACGVRKINFQVFYWDAPNQRILEAHIAHFLMGQPQPMRDLVNPAVDMANAGLWKDALVKITEARDLVSSYPESNVAALDWNYGLIRLHADAMAEDAAFGIYPLLSSVFYGDYAAAVDLMRPYSPEQVFSSDSPLIAGTVAEGYVGIVRDTVVTRADAALVVRPDLAEAYFLRGWAEYLVDPDSVQARDDVQQAAALRPDDAFLTDCAALFP